MDIKRSPRRDGRQRREYDVCPHRLYDLRGSSKKTQRKFCLQCHSFISEIPQEAAKERKGVSQSLAAGSEEALRASSNIMRQEPVERSKGETLARLKECARQIGQKPDHHKIKVGDLIKMLQECVDVVAETVPPVANMAIGSR